jgi:Ribonuclease G/E
MGGHCPHRVRRQDEAGLFRDLGAIVNLYAEIEKRAASRKAAALLHAESPSCTDRRDLLKKEFDRVFVNDGRHTTGSAESGRDGAKLNRAFCSSRARRFLTATIRKQDRKSARAQGLQKNGGYVNIDRTKAPDLIDDTPKVRRQGRLEKT